LALDWDAGHVYLVAASLGKSGVTIERALAWPEELPPGPGNADAFGQRVRDHLKEAGVGAAPLLIAASRDRLVLKEVRYPAVPAHEEPGVVRFQAVKELTDAADDVVIDYQASEVPEPSGERRALAVALRRELLQAYQTMAKAAGLKLAAITPRSYGILTALRRNAAQPPEPGTAFAALTIGDKAGEFAVARGDNLVFARALSGQALASDAALTGEIRRNLAVYAGQAGQYPVQALYIAESEGLSIGVGDRIRDKLTVPVHRFDPLAGLEPPAGSSVGSFAGAAGLLHLYSRSRELPINFVKPREPKPPADPNRRMYVLAASVVGLLILGGAAVAYGKLSAKDKVIRELTKDKTDYEQQLSLLDTANLRIKAVDAWLDSGVVVLDEFYNLAARFPDPTPIQLTKFDLRPVRQVASTVPGVKEKERDKNAPVVEVKIEGLTTAQPTSRSLLQSALASDQHIKLTGTPKTSAAPQSMTGGGGGGRGGGGPGGGGGGRGGGGGGRGGQNFTQQWSMAYTVTKRPPEEYLKQKLPASVLVPPRQNRNQRGGPGMGDGNDWFNGLMGGGMGGQVP
jgi:uncharacterized membrane protein YgcG